MVMPLPSPSRTVPPLFPTTASGASAGAELVTGDGRALSLVASTLTAHAHGGIARLVLEQRFENPHDDTLHVTYRMPLPADGAVSGYAFDLGDRTVTGVVDRKARARERFEHAIASGQTAALLEQERADLFTQRIGNLPPRTAVVARITIDQRLAWLPEGEWELRFPTVIGPRYIGTADTADDVRATHVKVTAQPLPVKVQLQLTIADAITGGRNASSPTHGLAPRGDGVIELQPGARLDRDLVVRWPVAARAVGHALEVARPAHGADAFGLLTIVPPSPEARAAAVARDLIVLLDTSGSMGGGPLDKAKQVVAMLIDSLDERDRFEVIEFSSRPSRFQAAPEEATAAAKRAAIQWVRSRQAGGGTEMRAAVIEALCTLRIGAQRQVVIVTDGYVGGEQQILRVLHDRLPPSCRLHVLGVGSAVNRSLATALARAGRGAEVVIGLDEDAERGAKRLLDRTKLPMLTNVEISGAALRQHAPAQLPDVFAGAPLVAALALRADGGELIVRGQLAGDTWEQRIRVPARASGQGSQAICALYAREHVADLEARSMLGEVNAEIEEHGLRFQIATRFTSWVAIDELRREVGPSRDELVPQELPYGTRASAFGLRAAGPLFTQQEAILSGMEVDEETIDGYGAGAMLGSSSAFSIDGAMPPPAARPAPVNRESARSATPVRGRVSPLRGGAPGGPAGFDKRAPKGTIEDTEGGGGGAPAERPKPSRQASPSGMKTVLAPLPEPTRLADVSAAAPTSTPPEDVMEDDDAISAIAAPTSSAPQAMAMTSEDADDATNELAAAAAAPRAQAAVVAVAKPRAATASDERAAHRKQGPASPRVQRWLTWYSLAFYGALIALLLWWLLR